MPVRGGRRCKPPVDLAFLDLFPCFPLHFWPLGSQGLVSEQEAAKSYCRGGRRQLPVKHSCQLARPSLSPQPRGFFYPPSPTNCSSKMPPSWHAAVWKVTTRTVPLQGTWVPKFLSPGGPEGWTVATSLYSTPACRLRTPFLPTCLSFVHLRWGWRKRSGSAPSLLPRFTSRPLHLEAEQC